MRSPRVKLSAPVAPAKQPVARAKLPVSLLSPAKVASSPPASPAAAQAIKFLSSGSCLLDLMLGGGWAQGRVINLVGDRSSGKTLLAIEAAANFVLDNDVADARYVEAEAAFDEEYAQSIGFPKGLKIESTINTVEKFHDDLMRFCAINRKGRPCLYVLDSLDALSDEAEQDRDMGDATYGSGKAKRLSEMFRRDIKKIEAARCTLIIISQIRDKLNVTFGETKTRSGGRALDFYCSQIVWLAEIGKLKRQVYGAERVIGVRTLAKCKKNKVGIPFREAEVNIIFAYGVDDEQSMINWLKKHKATERLPKPLSAIEADLLIARGNEDRDALGKVNALLSDAVIDQWTRIEAALQPPMSKYR